MVQPHRGPLARGTCLVALLLAAAAPPANVWAAGQRIGYAAQANVASDLKETVHSMEGPDFTCPLDIYQVLPAMNITAPLPCAEGKCEDLRGKVALITGGSTGIGRGTADRLVRAGMRVVATSRTPDQYVQPCPPNNTYREPGDLCMPVGFDLWQLDQTSQASVDALLKKVKDKYGRIDFLFLNAGRGAGEPMFRGETSLGPLGSLGYNGCNMLKAMQLDMETNLWGAVRMWEAALPLMPTNGYARVVLTSSVYAPVLHGSMVYTASKRGVDALAEAWMAEKHGKPTSIQVTLLYPGNIKTDVIRDSVMACRVPPSAMRMAERAAFSGVTPFMTATEAGEAVYRLAIDPQPPKRVLMAQQDAVPFFLKRICRHWALPMESWVPVGWNRARAGGSGPAGEGLMPTVWGS